MKKILRNLAVLTGILFLAGWAAFKVFPLPGHIPVLMYHFVGNEKDAEEMKNFVSRESLSLHMKRIRDWGFHVISVEELEKIKKGELKPRGREIAITFDDGNYTFAREALPILKDYQYPVTLFVVSESIKNQSNGSMSEPVIKELLNYPWIRIGSHSKTHPVLSELSEDRLRDELAGAKKDLEQMFQVSVPYFAYPSGDLSQTVRTLVEESGYRLAFTTSPKKLKHLEEDVYSVTRVKISRTSDNPIAFWVKLSGIYQFFKSLSR